MFWNRERCGWILITKSKVHNYNSNDFRLTWAHVAVWTVSDFDIHVRTRQFRQIRARSVHYVKCRALLCEPNLANFPCSCLLVWGCCDRADIPEKWEDGMHLPRLLPVPAFHWCSIVRAVRGQQSCLLWWKWWDSRWYEETLNFCQLIWDFLVQLRTDFRLELTLAAFSCSQLWCLEIP